MATNPGYKRLCIRQPVKKTSPFIAAVTTILSRRVSPQHYHWATMFVNSPGCLAVCWKGVWPNENNKDDWLPWDEFDPQLHQPPQPN